MRNAVVQLCLVIIGVTSIHAAKLLATSSFHLRIDPAGSVDKVRAIRGRDTLDMTNMNGVYYLRSANPGRWEVMVGAVAPYQDARYTVTVGPGGDMDMGVVRLRR